MELVTYNDSVICYTDTCLHGLKTVKKLFYNISEARLYTYECVIYIECLLNQHSPFSLSRLHDKID